MNMHSFFDAFSTYKKIPLWALCCLSILTFPNLANANSIGDFVWDDLNANGIQDFGEPGIPNIPVYLYDSSSNFVEGTATDANGFYQITNIVAGTYFINLPIPLSFPYFATTNNVGDDNFDSDITSGSQSEPFVYSGVAITNIDAGYVKYSPGIQVTKLASDPVKTAPDGTPLYITNDTWVTYTYIITNTGDANLSYVFLSDDILFPFGLEPNPLLIECPSQFAPGQVITYTTQVLLNASATNIASVQALPVNFKTCDLLDLPPVEDEDDAVVLLVRPGYDFEKTLISPTGRAARVGENIQFTISIINTGDVDLVVVPVVDTYDTNYIQYVSSVPPSVNNVNDGTINWTNIGPIAAFNTGTITATFTAVRTTFSELLTNVAVTAPLTPTNVPGIPPQTNDAPYEISNPGYTVLKTVSSPAMPAVVGDTITFQVQIVNTGDVTLATIPLADTYDTSFLSYDSSVPASEDNVNDGTINWTNVGPLAAGQLTNIFVSFLAMADTDGFDETNVVVAAPTVPPDEPPVPPQTSSVPYEIITPADLLLDKQFISATEPNTNGIFEILYTVTVTNAGEDSGIYYLLDTPVPDPEVTISGGNVTGHTNLTLVGSGPYLLATNETILGGATHVYTLRLDAVLSADVLNGETSVSLCDFADTVPGQGLYNEVLLQYGDIPTVLNAFDCGDVPPFLFLDKSFLGTTDPDALGNFSVTYQITVQNVGGTDGVYDLNDTPDPDPNVSILGGLVTGHSNVTLVGSGPYSIVVNEIIAASATHIYTVRLDAALSSNVLNGSTTVSQCSGGEDDSVAGEGLFNEAVVVYGSSDTAITNDACGDVPPLMVLEKDFISVSDLDNEGNFTVTYTISVLNSGGSAGLYDLNDNPQPDPHVTITGGVVSGYASLLLGPSSPYGLATNEPIAAGVTHVYTVLLYAVVSSDILTGEEDILDCGEGNGTPQAGEGMFNEAVVIYGDNDTTITNDACGDLPPILVLEKDFLSTTDPDALGNFSVSYTITVFNNGGSSGTYDLTDTPAPDTEVTILGGDVTGHVATNLTGPGPYTIITNELIVAAATHVYTVRLDAVLSADVLSGGETVSQCGTSLPQPESGLYNEAVVTYGDVSITNDACGEIPAFIVMEKDFVSATEADALGNFTFEYVLTVLNSGGNSGSYDLVDDPSPDANITITNGAVTGHIPQALVGAGPYTLATAEAIGAGVLHVYTVQLNAAFSGNILSGTTNIITCGETTGTPQPDEALFNIAVVIFGEDDTTITNDACGNAPPFLVIDKEFINATEPDQFGDFAVEYVVTVKNSGGSSTFYGLTDTPSPDTNVTINGATISGHTNDAILGSGPYTLATSNTLLVGETHTYTVRLDAVLSSDILSGFETVSQCGEDTGTPAPGEGLYNEAEVTYGDDITITTNACGDIPPFLVMNKFFVSASGVDANGSFIINYQITVVNSGGTATSYDLQDVPAPDLNVTVTGGVVSGQANFALLGSGPWTLASNETISAVDSHVYNIELYAVLGSNIVNGTVDVTRCGENTGTPQSGEGLYNEAVLSYGTNDLTVTNSTCGEVPPFITVDKQFIEATEADLDGNFVVTYAVTVHNSGGSQTNYNLVDTPYYDTNIVVTGATVIGQTSQTSGTFPALPTFGRPFGAQGYNPACLTPAITNANTNYPYFVLPIQASVLEKFTVETLNVGVSDPYIFVYCSFDPSNPTNNILAGNDDGGSGFQSAFLVSDQIELTPLTTYDLVVSLFSSTGHGNSNVVLTFGGSIVFNEAATNIAGPGPFGLATDKPLPAGSSHTYTVMVYAAYSPQVLAGDTIPSDCGLSGGGAVPGEGLFNLATVQFGDNELTFTNEACGDAPPFLTIDKEFLSVTGPDNFGNVSALYAIEVFNSGGSATYYNLTDTPTPDSNVTFTNGSVTGHTNLALVGAGPYTLAINETIGSGILHVYTVRVNGVLSSDLMLGVVTSSICSGGPGGGQPGEALYNFALLIYGDSNTTITDSDCGDIPEPVRLDIGDTVWVDLNNNGIPDENLAVQGLNYVRVDLYNTLNGVTNFVDFRITTTNGIQRGFYIFTNLANYGVYIVQVDISTVPPTVNVPTTPTRYFVPPTPGLSADFGFMPGNPTAVDLVEFRAEVFASQVQLIWETATELDNMGFNLYRATSPDGERTRINDELIPGRGTGLGGSYQFFDPAALDDGTYYYWLEDVEFNFSTREHGPLRVTVGSATTLAKVGSTSIQNDGVVMITAGTFERSGINLATIDPSRLRFFIDNEEVAVYSTASGSMMKSYDYILVYLDNESGDSVELSVGYASEGEPLRIGMDFAFLSGDAGDVMTGRLPDGAGYMRLSMSQAYVRCLLTGFSDPLIWLFDITNSGQPTLLLGADTVSVGGEVGLYFSYPIENSELIAISADSISEVNHFDP